MTNLQWLAVTCSDLQWVAVTQRSSLFRNVSSMWRTYQTWPTGSLSQQSKKMNEKKSLPCGSCGRAFAAQAELILESVHKDLAQHFQTPPVASTQLLGPWGERNAQKHFLQLKQLEQESARISNYHQEREIARARIGPIVFSLWQQRWLWPEMECSFHV